MTPAFAQLLQPSESPLKSAFIGFAMFRHESQEKMHENLTQVSNISSLGII